MIAERVIQGDIAGLDGPEPYRLDEVDVIYAETGGLITYKAEIGEYVEDAKCHGPSIHRSTGKRNGNPRRRKRVRRRARLPLPRDHSEPL